MVDEEKGSFADPNEIENKEKKRPVIESDATAPLFRVLEKIAKGIEANVTNCSNAMSVLSAVRDRLENIDKSIKENTGAVNALLTTLVTSDEPPRYPDEKKPSTPITSQSVQNTFHVKPSSPPLPVATPLPSSDPIKIVMSLFPEDLESMLDFKDDGDYVTVKPKQFLGSDNFSKIASVVRSAGGEYVSAGKGSHFKVPNKK